MYLSMPDETKLWYNSSRRRACGRRHPEHPGRRAGVRKKGNDDMKQDKQAGGLAGIYQATSRGFGFLVPEDGGGREDDWFIPPRAEGGAWHGDRVLVKLSERKNGRGRREAAGNRCVKYDFWRNTMSKSKILSNPWVVAVLALFCAALWGSATPFIKIGYELILPEKNVPSTILFAGVRFFFAGVITVLIYSIASGKLLYPQKANIGKIAQVSVFQTVLQYIFFYVGLANTSGVKGTILSGTSAFFSLLIASLIFKQEKLTPGKIIGCISGFAGIIFVNLNGLDFTMNFTGDCFVLFSAVALGFSSVLMKKYSKDENPVVISGYQFIMGGIAMVLIGIVFGGKIVVSGGKALGVLTYLSFLSAAAYAIWGVLLKNNPVSRVTVYSFMTPVMGVLLSNLLLTEQNGVSAVNLVVTLVFVCAGILILNYKKA